MPVRMRGGGEPSSTQISPTYLDHDHHEGENIRFLAVCPLVIQDLRRSPPRGMTLIVRGALRRVRIRSDRREAEVRDPRVVVGVQENIRLDACQHGGKTGFRQITYTLEITVNYIAGVEKVKAFGDIK